MNDHAAPIEAQPGTQPDGNADVELSVIIPAWNEAERLPTFLEHVLKWCREQNRKFEVIVVDDGSTDSTAELVQQNGASELRLVSHLENAGKGAGVRTGMQHARGKLRLFADADGATQMTELPALEKAIVDGADIAIGSREGADKLVECSPLRRFLGRWFNRVVRMGSVKGIRDTQCGFKLFAPTGTALFEIAMEDGFAFDVELLYLAQRKSLSIAEVFVNWTEQPGSKVKLFRDGWRMLKANQRIKRRWRNGKYDTVEPRVTPAREITKSVEG